MSPASRRRKKVHRFRVGGWYKGFCRLVVKQIRKEVCIRLRFWHTGEGGTGSERTGELDGNSGGCELK